MVHIFIPRNGIMMAVIEKSVGNKIKDAKGYQVYRYDYFLKKWNKILTTKKTYFKILICVKAKK